MKRICPSHFLGGALALALLFAGALEPLERELLQWRFSWLQRPASGALTIVEIDARSLHELDTWPWPRRYHAELIERLVDAGAKHIALDVDFSARSSPEEDDALNRAVVRAGDRLILPTFVQGAQVLSSAPTYENVPHRRIRAQARLGAVNVHTSADGRIWRYPVAETLPSGYRPSLAVRIAGAGHFSSADFMIDFGVQPDTIRRISYVDVLHGNYAPDAFAGRDVLVGSTATELGDYLGVPVYRTLPGVLIHGLAYESIVQGRMLQRTGSAVTAAGVLLFVLLLAPFMGTVRASWLQALIAATVAAAAILGLTIAVQDRFAIAVDSAAWLATFIFLFLAALMRRLRHQAILLFRQRMAQTHTRALMRSVVEDSFDGIVIVGASGHIELANRAAHRILGRAAAMEGLPLDAVLPGWGGLTKRDLTNVPDDEVRCETDVRRDDGSTVSLEIVLSTSELRLSKKRYERRKRERHLSIYTFRDITERRQMLEAQKNALDAALSVNRVKSQFLANISHELRTPLNAILGFSEFIKEAKFGPLTSRYQDYAGDIHASGVYLLGIINDILDTSKSEAGHLILHEDAIDLPPIINECSRLVAERAQRGKVNVTLDFRPSLPCVHADRLRIKQALLNVLSNAVKFTPPGGHVSVSVDQPAGGGIAVVVVDTGIGMKEEDVPLALEPFRQIDGSLARRYEGTGLGLPLAKSFLELHGGKVEIVSEPAVGTTVTLWLPPGRVIDARTVQA